MVRKGDGFDVALAWMRARRYAEIQEEKTLEVEDLAKRRPEIKEAAIKASGDE